MRADLIRHPAAPSTAIDRVEVEVERLDDERIALTYRAFGDLDRLWTPPVEPEGRTDELWRRTCFEAFIGGSGRTDYRELNFAGRRWAAYRFTGRREGMADDPVEPSEVGAAMHADHYETYAVVMLDRAAPWRAGLTAVIEDIDGGVSYWALAHPSDKPDFHHPDSFVLDLP